nr:MAG TPA: hypothetical protein [Caudoviricetes sp.]DAO75223.1 MAG TPA: hypothetical protein [Bacteriophage sp.]
MSLRDDTAFDEANTHYKIGLSVFSILFNPFSLKCYLHIYFLQPYTFLTGTAMPSK